MSVNIVMFILNFSFDVILVIYMIIIIIPPIIIRNVISVYHDVEHVLFINIDIIIVCETSNIPIGIGDLIIGNIDDIIIIIFIIIVFISVISLIKI